MKLIGNFVAHFSKVMNYKFRAILDVEENVIRDIVIPMTFSLEDLHHAISDAFGFNGNEMASFYLSDENWNQGEEFPLFDMNDKPGQVTQMSEISIRDVVTAVGDKMIYVFDFLNMWTFFVELMESDNIDDLDSFSKVVFSMGAVPKNAPEKLFEAETDDPYDLGLDNEELDEDFDFEGFSYEE